MPNTSSKNYVLLAGDIGGTKTTLGLYHSQLPLDTPLKQHTFHNYKYKNLEDIISKFLTDFSPQPLTACLGIAGPVLGAQVQLTNLKWMIDANILQEQFGFIRVDLINDLVVTAIGAMLLTRNDLLSLNAGSPNPQGTVAVIAPGTGLGEAFLMLKNKTWLPGPSEGGHCSFAPTNDLQMQLWQFLHKSTAHISVEQVCSGRAIPTLYNFLRTMTTEPDWMRLQLETNEDKTPIIIQAALNSRQKIAGPCKIAEQTLQLFIDILASETSNLTLKTLATGGVYIGGGLPPRILPFLTQQNFMNNFCRGVYKEMLSRIPVHIILNTNTALLGAAAYGFQKLAPLTS
jgi:glucokinase